MNILFLMADQLAPQFLPAWGHRIVKTPHMDSIAENAVLFDAHYSNAPLCVPARAGLMTGQLPSRVDVFDSGCDYAFSVPTLAHYFRDNGYVTVLSGKAHFVGADQLHGFESRLTTDICPSDNCWYATWDDPDRPRDWFHNLHNVVTSGVAQRASQQDHDEDAAYAARRWLFDYARSDETRPFFLKVSFSHPHDPYVTPQAYWDRYRHDDIDMPVTPGIARDDRDAHGQWLHDHYDRGEFEITEEDIRRSRHGYYGSISFIDDLIGNLLETLKATQLDEDTIVVFTADHGDMLGERGYWYKMSFYEHACRIPLIISVPGMNGTRRTGHATSLVDLLPTLMDLALPGGTGNLVEPIDGKSLISLIEGGKPPWSDVVCAEAFFEGVAAPGVMLRRGRQKYVHWDGKPCSLFDLESDPNETENLVDEPARHDEVLELEREVRERWPLEQLTRTILRKQRRNALVHSALMTGSVTPLDFQPFTDAAQQYYRGHGNWHDAEKRDLLRINSIR